MNDVDVLIAGGGISGLSIAWWLARRGVRVELWERDARAGGLIATHRQDGYLTEQAASMVLNFRPEVDRFLEESGLVEFKRLRAPLDRRYLVRNCRLIAMPTRLRSLATSPLWSLRGKLRLLLEPFIPRGANPDETVSEFICRRLGREILETAIEPYVGGVLAADPDRASAAATLPRLTALEKACGSITLGVLSRKLLHRRTAMGMESFSFHGGMSTLVETLAANPRIRFRTAHEVTALEPTGDGWTVHGRIAGSGIHSIRARHVVLSTPAEAAARLTAPLSGTLGKNLSGIESAPVIQVHLGLDRAAIRHPLDGSGFLSPRAEGCSVTGSLWMSRLFEDRAPEGKVLLSNYLGGARRPEAANWSDGRCTDETLRALRPLLGVRGDPEMVHIDRHLRGLPVYHGAHTARLRAIDEELTRLPGLHLEANYREGVSIRDRIARGLRVADNILPSLTSRHAGRLMPGSLSPAIPVAE